MNDETEISIGLSVGKPDALTVSRQYGGDHIAFIKAKPHGADLTKNDLLELRDWIDRCINANRPKHGEIWQLVSRDGLFIFNEHTNRWVNPATGAITPAHEAGEPLKKIHNSIYRS